MVVENQVYLFRGLFLSDLMSELHLTAFQKIMSKNMAQKAVL